MAAWSAMTALCAAAGGFGGLMLARIGVGIGEAGSGAPSQSLVGDYFPPEKRASALAFYSLGIPVGTLLGMIIGGTLADYVGWREAFVIVGLPGVILALVVYFLVKSLNKLTELGKKKEEAAPAEPPKPSNEELLLTEIRDLLKEQK